VNEIQNTPYVSVEGQGEVKVAPDIAILSIGVLTEAKSAKTAQKENAEISNDVIASLKAIGINESDIETSSYTINRAMDYSEGKAVLRGYTVQHQFEVTIRDIEQIGMVYDSAVAAGANVAHSLRFKISNEQKYYLVALEKAIKNAQKKVLTIAKSASFYVYPTPYRIIEENSKPIRPLQTFKAEEMALPNTMIMQRQVIIKANLTVLYTIYHQ
jgi:uncharacterized protein